MNQIDYINDLIEQCQSALNDLPEQYARAKRDSDREIDALCEEAGIMSKVEEHRNQLKAIKQKIQGHADNLTGRLLVLKDIRERFLIAPIPEGVTHMHGIELHKLDSQTRLRVMNGDPTQAGWLETISALGGVYTPPAPEIDEEDDIEEDEDLDCDGDDDLDAALEEEDDEIEEDDDQLQEEVQALADAVFGPDATPLAEEEEEDDSLDDLDNEINEIEARIADGSASEEDIERVRTLLNEQRSLPDQ